MMWVPGPVIWVILLWHQRCRGVPHCRDLNGRQFMADCSRECREIHVHGIHAKHMDLTASVAMPAACPPPCLQVAL